MAPAIKIVGMLAPSKQLGACTTQLNRELDSQISVLNQRRRYRDTALMTLAALGVQDFMLAKATYDAAVRRWPKARIRLCQEARIVEDSSNPA